MLRVLCDIKRMVHEKSVNVAWPLVRLSLDLSSLSQAERPRTGCQQGDGDKIVFCV